MTRSSGYGQFPDKSMRNRFLVLWRQAFNNGIGYFLVSMSCIVLSFLFIRFAYDYYRDYSSRLAKQLECLGSESEPQREDRYSGISAMLLGSVNLDWQDSRARMQAVDGYRVVDDSRKLVADLTCRISGILEKRPKGIEDRRQALAVADSLIEDLKPVYPDYFALLSRRNMPRSVDLRQVVGEVLGWTWPKLTTRKLDKDEEARFPWPPPLIIEPGHRNESAGMILSVYSGVIPLTMTAGQAQMQSTLERRIYNAIIYSRLLDAATIALEALTFEAARKGDQSPWFQAYFISPDNILRLWQQDDNSRAIVEKLAPLRYWAAARYEEELLAGKRADYLSKAYFDYAEGGVVFTEAMACSLADGSIAGIMTTDFRVPMRAFLKSVASHILLFDMCHVKVTKAELDAGHGGRAEVPSRGNMADRLLAVLFPRLDPATTVWEDASSDATQRAVAIVHEAREDPEFCRNIQGVPSHNRTSYVVPIKTTGDSEIDVLVLDPHRPVMPAEVIVFGFLGILCGTLAVSLFFIGSRLCNSDNELETRRALLRGLQVGFVRCDGTGMILEGNDRAEEILGVELPMVDASLGSAARRTWREGRQDSILGFTSRRIGDFIVQNEVILRNETIDGAELKQFDDVLERLERGRRSLMYSHLVVNGKLISMLSTPILGTTRSSIDSGFFATFDTLNGIESVAVQDKFDELVAERAAGAAERQTVE